VLDLFHKLGADFNITNAANETPLHFASSHETSRVVMPLLLRYRVDVNARNKNGETPLHYAARNGLLDVAALLITHGEVPTA
jgi:ankyrin repeat protein